ncbi:MAG: hypothetical protein WAU90_00755 [Methyloceanibacter sp.]
MSITAQSEDAFLTGPAAAGERVGEGRAAGFAGSAVLHGLLLLLIVLAMPPGTLGSSRDVLSIPVEVSLGDDIKPAKKTEAAELPQQASQSSPSSPAVSGEGPSASGPLDALDAKLKALAELHQPDAATTSEGNGSGQTTMIAVNEQTAGELAAAKDLIRVQVMRRWNLDLKGLSGGDSSVPIRVRVGSDGVVLKAELVDTPRSADPAYREIALSAKNAVLMSSPFTLPPGHYRGVMDLVLDLNPRDALH